VCGHVCVCVCVCVCGQVCKNLSCPVAECPTPGRNAAARVIGNNQHGVGRLVEMGANPSGGCVGSVRVAVAMRAA